jgi:hypothetical protein
MTVNIASIPAETANSQAYQAAQARTKAQRAVTAFNILNRRCDSEIYCAEDNITKFKAKLGVDACYAFSWADSTIRSAAALKVWGKVKHDLLEGATMLQVQSMAQRYVMQGARNPSQSTSVCSNLVETYATSVWAEVLELLNECVKHSTTDEA